MNIGKIICLLLIIPLCCGCNEHETSSAPSFRQCFIEVYYSGGLELPMLQTGYFGTQPTVPPQNLQTGFVITPNYSHNNMCDSFSDPEEFLRLATRNMIRHSINGFRTISVFAPLLLLITSESCML